MKTEPDHITPELLRQLLDYNPETGSLVWLHRDRSFFASERSFKAWNTKFAGQEAGCNDGFGYIKIAVFEKKIQAHRAIWALVHGEWPNIIDHINHNRMDNRLENLRNVSNEHNTKNKGVSSTNTSGYNGVSWDKGTRKWRAKISVNGATVHLGLFSNPEDAAEARAKADVFHGYHENHGVDLI